MEKWRGRSVPATLALGLPTALFAHVLAFGQGHIAAGEAHTIFVQFALALSGATVLLLGTLSALGARNLRDGSVLAAKLRVHLPKWPSLLASCVACFLLIESAEPAHDVHFGVAALGIGFAVAIVHLLLSRFVTTLAHATIAIVRTLTVARRPAYRPNRRVSRPPHLPVFALLRRLEIRPPPLRRPLEG
ncbi:MAG TPA: hypothetical protein VGZ00_01700 [Candidatus Baltobacteraceae bacterium]|nr:hypothetical protein [Candidatus Baltobacteraceae bacterium]